MKNLSKKLLLILVLIIGFIFGSLIPNYNSDNISVKEVSIFADTLVLDNQGEIDIYAVNDGKWIVVSLDDLRYILKKQRKTIIPNLESLFERFEVPDKIKVKPTFK